MHVFTIEVEQRSFSHMGNGTWLGRFRDGLFHNRIALTRVFLTKTAVDVANGFTKQSSRS